MNKEYEEGTSLIQKIVEDAKTPSGALVILGTPFIFLKEAVELTANNDQIKIAAQNCHQENSGAFTGEISVPMLKSIGVEYVIIGHSERREYFRESNERIYKKCLR